MTKEKNEILLFETEDKSISLPVEIKNETVWLNRNQMAELFVDEMCVRIYLSNRQRGGCCWW